LRLGFIQEEPPPFWITDKYGVALINLDEVKSTANEEDKKVKLSLEQYPADKKTGAAIMDKYDVVSTGMMTEICEVIFKEQQLSHSTAVVTVPLSFDLNDYIGRRVTVHLEGSAIEGGLGGSFDAFITGISHMVDLRDGKQMNSYSQVRCSHVTFDNGLS
jgi:hypothetical protein